MLFIILSNATLRLEAFRIVIFPLYMHGHIPNLDNMESFYNWCRLETK